MTFSTPSQHNSNFELRGVGNWEQHGSLKNSQLRMTKRNRNKDIEELKNSVYQFNNNIIFAEAVKDFTNTMKVQ